MISLSQPHFGCLETERALRAMRGSEDFTALCERHLHEITGNRCLLVTSATHALEAAALLSRLTEGDEFIVPSFTHPSTVNAFLLRGAKPVFVDVRADTLNLDERAVEAAITRRTRVIVAMHYGGVACRIDVLQAISSRYDVSLIEDAAHGLGGTFQDRSLGGFGRFACFSFHHTKNFSCDEGGALVLSSASDYDAAERLIHKGTDYLAFRRSRVDRYTWQGLGSSFTPSRILAAILSAQLERREEIQTKRRTLYARYSSNLADWCTTSGFRFQAVPHDSVPAWHVFCLIAPTADAQTRLVAHLRRNGVEAAAHFQALNATPMGFRLGGREGQCPVAEALSVQLLRLPLRSSLSLDDQDHVIEAVKSFRE